MRRGPHIRRQVEAHFYFPLLKTEKVLLSIHAMWAVICRHLRWYCPPLSHVLDRRYRYG